MSNFSILLISFLYWKLTHTRELQHYHREVSHAQADPGMVPFGPSELSGSRGDCVEAANFGLHVKRLEQLLATKEASHLASLCSSGNASLHCYCLLVRDDSGGVGS